MIFSVLDDRRDGVVVRASASQSVFLGFFSHRVIPKDFKKWYSLLFCFALSKIEIVWKQADKLACVLGQDT